LHLAAAKGHTEIANGADVNAIPKSDLFGTPLDYAIYRRQTEIRRSPPQTRRQDG
jgi:hypothetical protein